jgi:nitrite reductase/ring-hydroxylating ferredoxin subunit
MRTSGRIEPHQDDLGRPTFVQRPVSGEDPSFLPVAAADALTGDGTLICNAGSRQVLLVHHASLWYAIAPWCTHAGAPLDGGRIAGGKIHCPLHGAAFDLATGAALTPPAFRKIPIYPVRIVDGVIEVAFGS